MFLFSHSAWAKIVFWLFLDALSTFTFRAFDLMLLQPRIYLWIGFKASVNVFLPDISMASLIQFFTQELSSWRPLLTTLSKITFILTYLFCSSQHLSNIMCLLLVYCLFLLPECSFWKEWDVVYFTHGCILSIKKSHIVGLSQLLLSEWVNQYSNAFQR